MTQIWITLGPSSLETLDELIEIGVAGIRQTFSFGTYELQAERAVRVRQIAQRLGKECQVIADLPGGKFRLGVFTGNSSVVVHDGQVITAQLSNQADPIEEYLPVAAEELFRGLTPGSELIVGDGSVRFEVISVEGHRASLVVVSGGTVEQTRGVTLRGGRAEPEALTPADMSALRRIASDGLFDAVAVSFVSRATEIDEVRSVLRSAGSDQPIIAKIESRSGMRNLLEITQTADVVMAARGDLGLALHWVDLPGAVDDIADTANHLGKPWVLATQVFEGMAEFVMPTRAEICDLAHWLRRGCSAVLLSRETVFGPRPVPVVEATRDMIFRWGSQRDALSPPRGAVS